MLKAPHTVYQNSVFTGSIWNCS